jgi:hypothetical protein
VRRSQRPRGRKARAARRAGSEARGLRQGDGGEAGLAKVQLSRTPSAPGANARHTDAHTHTHTHSTAISCSARSPATHSAPSLRHGLTTAFPACTGGNTTGDSARMCRSEQRVMWHERADRVGAQIAWARGSEARRFGGRTGRACVSVRMWVGMRAPVCRTVGAQDGRCAGRSVRRTVGAQDSWFRGVAPT